jgi:ABC-type polysaccharide/polyol phosphate export permease
MICSRFRDVQQVIGSVLQISLFVTPIFFTADQLGPRFAAIMKLNPLFHYVEIVRAPLLGRAPAAISWAAVLLGTVVGWSFALWAYSRFRRRVPYWL